MKTVRISLQVEQTKDLMDGFLSKSVGEQGLLESNRKSSFAFLLRDESRRPEK